MLAKPSLLEQYRPFRSKFYGQRHGAEYGCKQRQGGGTTYHVDSTLDGKRNPPGCLALLPFRVELDVGRVVFRTLIGFLRKEVERNKDRSALLSSQRGIENCAQFLDEALLHDFIRRLSKFRPNHTHQVAFDIPTDDIGLSRRFIQGFGQCLNSPLTARPGQVL